MTQVLAVTEPAKVMVPSAALASSGEATATAISAARILFFIIKALHKYNIKIPIDIMMA
jgi:hypothetical protein